jgi:NADPH-dependent curcumin reductase CurA
MKNFSREIRLVSRPNGAATHSNFEIAEVELSPLGSGEIRVRNTWMSVDPYMRGRMRDYESYLPPFQIGKVLEGMAVGEVVESNDPGFATGDTVMSMMGWREAIVPDIPSVAVRLLLKKSEHEYGDLDTIRSYRSVVEKTYEYDNVEKVVASIEENIIFPAEAKVQELRRRS